MWKNYSLRTFKYLQTRQDLIKNNLELTMAIKRNVPVREDYLSSALESKGSQIKQIEWGAYLTASQRSQDASKFQNRFIARVIAKG